NVPLRGTFPKTRINPSKPTPPGLTKQIGAPPRLSRGRETWHYYYEPESPEKPSETATALRCPAEGEGGGARFRHEFAERTRLTGRTKLRLWIEADGSDDADLFVVLRKIDRSGEAVPFPFFALYDDGPVALGWQRASHRALDEERSTPWQPWHTHDREERLEPGVPVPVEIEIWPSSTLFEAGEQLELVVQGSDFMTGVLPGHRTTRNKGDHIIHSGGDYDSHLLIPVIPSA
ncbi:CocE/NonD family hydrolase C-terminal non-catalytic domain-containing protein, partial [Streptomyces sp. NPDC051162]|uniref:CocE/NonD family hydrolase C-terminal non-catalytic domain-containing protein n=1 Tax=Streptomyces sp. NPDC051162 TaxID=3154747 RepID=UPI003414D3A1